MIGSDFEEKEDPASLLNGLVLYRQGEDSLIRFLLHAFTDADSMASAASALLDRAYEFGWQGDLWHAALTYALVMNENPFSLGCERCAAAPDSLRQFALWDMEVFRRLFELRFPGEKWQLLHNFTGNRAPTDEGTGVMELSCALASLGSAEEMLSVLTDFYRVHGLGLLGLGQVFRVERLDKGCRLYPVARRRKVRLADLVGYESQKKALVENTEAFTDGRHANNVLLYGDAGTGKSTSIQAISCEYADRGLRLIEIYKDQYDLIPQVIRMVKNRRYRFLLFLDDLSFEENEVSYKYLKAVMEGGAEASPENVRIYATSNRRHLVREVWNDRNDVEHNGDIHRSDTMEEKLSLAARFGLQIFYPAPTFEEFQNIVSVLSERNGQSEKITPEQLRSAAATWQVRSGSRSGRTAQQFIDALVCREQGSGKES